MRLKYRLLKNDNGAYRAQVWDESDAPGEWRDTSFELMEYSSSYQPARPTLYTVHGKATDAIDRHFDDEVQRAKANHWVTSQEIVKEQ